jgi:hypothetical protein
MYYEVVSQCVRTLKTIEIWLDRAEAHTAAKKFDVDDKSARQVVRAVPHP